LSPIVYFLDIKQFRGIQNKLYFEPNKYNDKITIFFPKHLKICPMYLLRQNSRSINIKVSEMMRSGEEIKQGR
jgi:hypothetical protein